MHAPSPSLPASAARPRAPVRADVARPISPCSPRQAAALAPGWPKAAYRLGGVLHALGRRRGAAAALRRAARLADEQGEAGEIGAEIGARLRSVEQELEEEQEASAARRAEAGRRAAGGDWEGARAAYTELIDGAVAAAAEEREEQREEDDEDEGGEEPGGGGGGGAADGPEPALYANRAACMLRLGRLHECVADCDAALIPRVGGARAASADGGVPDRLRWKLLLRRAEAHKGLGRPAQAARDLDAAARLPHDADAAKVLEHMRADLHDAAL